MGPFFKILKYLTWEKKPWDELTEEEKASVNVFMLHRYLSMNVDYIHIVNLIQTMAFEKVKEIYNSYLNLLPRKNVFLKYIKPKATKNKNELASYVARHYNCSLGEADEYISLLGKGVTNLLFQQGLSDKEIRKLTKNLR
jgi:hypothetical protein